MYSVHVCMCVSVLVFIKTELKPANAGDHLWLHMFAGSHSLIFVPVRSCSSAWIMDDAGATTSFSGAMVLETLWLSREQRRLEPRLIIQCHVALHNTVTVGTRKLHRTPARESNGETHSNECVKERKATDFTSVTAEICFSLKSLRRVMFYHI